MSGSCRAFRLARRRAGRLALPRTHQSQSASGQRCVHAPSRTRRPRQSRRTVRDMATSRWLLGCLRLPAEAPGGGATRPQLQLCAPSKLIPTTVQWVGARKDPVALGVRGWSRDNRASVWHHSTANYTDATYGAELGKYHPERYIPSTYATSCESDDHTTPGRDASASFASYSRAACRCRIV